MTSEPNYIINIPEFQGYISPDVEDAIKNDSGGNYLLDFLKNGLLIVKAKASGENIYLSHSYDTIMEALEHGALVFAMINNQQYVLSEIKANSIIFSKTVLDGGKIYLCFAEIDSQNRLFDFDYECDITPE